MMLDQERQGLVNRHLKERQHNATINTSQWRALRIRQRKEIDRTGLALVSLVQWVRLKGEIAELGMQQRIQLDLLRISHGVETADLSSHQLETVAALANQLAQSVPAPRYGVAEGNSEIGLC